MSINFLYNLLLLSTSVASVIRSGVTPRLHQRNMLRATSCLKQHVVARNKQHVAGNKQFVARNLLLVARNMLLVRATCCRATCCAGVNAALGLG